LAISTSRSLSAHQLALLVRRRTALLDRDALLLRDALALVGRLELVGELLALPRHQQLGRHRGIAEAHLLDRDPRLEAFREDGVLDERLERVALVDEVEHPPARRPGDVAHDAAQRRRHDAVLDLLQTSH